MIPYQDLRFKDWNFYWGSSVLFAKIDDVWYPVVPCNRRDDGDLLYSPSSLLEELSAANRPLKFRHFLEDRPAIEVDPLVIFSSKDWITYEPQLGYFKSPDGRRLVLIASTAGRTYVKGLNRRKIVECEPIDSAILPRSILRLAEFNLGQYSFNSMVQQITERMNTQPQPWGTVLRSMMQSSHAHCQVLDPTTAAVFDPTTSRVFLLFNGVYVGCVNAAMEFRPREKRVGRFDAIVHRIIKGNLKEITNVKC